MPKAGWTLDTDRKPYAKAYELEHGKISEGVREIKWTGNLPDAWYDEFVFTGSIAADLAPGSTLYFPVVQECEKGFDRWIEIPDGSGRQLESPAPGLMLLPPAQRAH